MITGAFCYDADGFDRALELLAAPGFPQDLLDRARRRRARRLLGAIEMLGAGEIPAKVDGRAEARTHEPRPTRRSGKPRFNHVAMSVPVGLCSTRTGRKLLCDFYGEVFGWQ